jgi:hypothetical protein
VPLIEQMAGECLARGDILRLVYNYNLGPGSPPVDLMVYDPRDDDCGMGLMVVSGYKAGLVYAILPLASKPQQSRGLSVDWLVENWSTWFCHEWDGEMRVIPLVGSRALRWDECQIIAKDEI